MASHKLLGIRESEFGIQYLQVFDCGNARERDPDLRRDRIVPFTMPAQILLGLLIRFSKFGIGAMVFRYRR